jgi:tryptophan synthase alpha chain
MSIKQLPDNALMAHVYYGDPDEGFSEKLISALIESGIDLLEFGIPFSDPTADGPTFMNACTRALRNKMTPSRCIQGISKIREKGYTLPIAVTTYYNLVYQYGIKRFIRDIKEAGADALIVPEAVPEESEELHKCGKEFDIDLIYLVGQRSSDVRIKKIVSVASGFIYLISSAGVTGIREELKDPIAELINKVHQHSDLPLLVGFGISKPEHFEFLMKNGANGVIIGSAIAKIYEKHISRGIVQDQKRCLEDVSEFIRKMKQ